MDGGLIVGLINFSDAGHIYYERLIMLKIPQKMEKDYLKTFIHLSKS